MRQELKLPTEKVIHSQICDYLKRQFPQVIFTSDPSGLRISVGLRMELKRKRCVHYKIPDLLILHPSKGYHGLCIEIKRSVDDVFKKSGSVRDKEHLQEQKKTIDRLNELGFKAVFGAGFNHCKNIIDEYLKP